MAVAGGVVAWIEGTDGGVRRVYVAAEEVGDELPFGSVVDIYATSAREGDELPTFFWIEASDELPAVVWYDGGFTRIPLPFRPKAVVADDTHVYVAVERADSDAILRIDREL